MLAWKWLWGGGIQHIKGLPRPQYAATLRKLQT